MRRRPISNINKPEPKPKAAARATYTSEPGTAKGVRACTIIKAVMAAGPDADMDRFEAAAEAAERSDLRYMEKIRARVAGGSWLSLSATSTASVVQS